MPLHAARRPLKAFSPSFREIEFTMHLPWEHFSPACTTWNFELSIMKGTRLISGSETSRLTNFVIAASPSIKPSSMLMSRTSAPCCTCFSAIAAAFS